MPNIPLIAHFIPLEESDLQIDLADGLLSRPYLEVAGISFSQRGPVIPLSLLLSENKICAFTTAISRIPYQNLTVHRLVFLAVV